MFKPPFRFPSAGLSPPFQLAPVLPQTSRGHMYLVAEIYTKTRGDELQFRVRLKRVYRKKISWHNSLFYDSPHMYVNQVMWFWPPEAFQSTVHGFPGKSG